MFKLISHFAFILLVIASTPCSLFGEGVNKLPAFEKLYVTPNDVLCTPEGTFYHSPEGEYLKVCSINRDAHGPYVILITRQCPICGRYYNDHTDAIEGYSCEVWDIKP